VCIFDTLTKNTEKTYQNLLIRSEKSGEKWRKVEESGGKWCYFLNS
jgi:hypothetical protein